MMTSASRVNDKERSRSVIKGLFDLYAITTSKVMS